MATLYTDLTDSTNTHENAHQRDDARSVTSGLFIATATYTNTTGTDEATSDTYNLVKLPTHSVVMPAFCYCTHGDMATTAYTLTVGDAGDPNRYAESITCASDAGIKPFILIAATTLPAGETTPYVIPEGANRMITATATTITTPTASAVIRFHIVYRLLTS